MSTVFCWLFFYVTGGQTLFHKNDTGTDLGVSLRRIRISLTNQVILYELRMLKSALINSKNSKSLPHGHGDMRHPCLTSPRAPSMARGPMEAFGVLTVSKSLHYAFEVHTGQPAYSGSESGCLQKAEVCPSVRNVKMGLTPCHKKRFSIARIHGNIGRDRNLGK